MNGSTALRRGRLLSLAAILTIAGCSSGRAAGQAAQPDRPAAAAETPAADTAAVAAVLDSLHQQAAAANEAAYFGLFAPDGVFHGTDATERWTVDEFRAYAAPHFRQGRGWTYVVRPGTRHIAFDPAGNVAWFDEILDNASYGETRGTGVLRRVDGAWRIAQYHLTIPVPNALADTVVQMIRARP